MARNKVLFWAFALLMVAVLAACGGGNNAANGSTQPTEADAPAVVAGTPETAVDEPAPSVSLRLSVSLTPQELESFQAALDQVTAVHPEWSIELELIPQQGVVEKVSTQLAGNDLPDVFRAQGLLVQQWVRQGAFLDLTPFIEQSGLDMGEFYDGPVDQFRWNGELYGIPDTAAPDVVFYNKDMFDAAGLAYPTDEWTYDDMRDAALLLTLDENGRNVTDPDFDPEAIVQWGWNGGLTFFWQRHLVRGFGGDFCANEDCTLMNFTAPETIAAAQWWADLTNQDHATLYDPYGGSQTGVPGDPFISGKAAMGYNGFFAVGQLNDAGNINYDVIQPLLGSDGNRYTPLSTNGYVIAANTEHPDAAWALVQALTEAEFLAETWGKPGHSVPARRAAADSVINPELPLTNQQAIVAAMEYGEVFKPYTSSAFETYGKTAEFFTKMMSGEMPVAEAMAQIEAAANETLAADREQ
ncbi:MAG: sugar ABC transporter substrate-binding protein [Chloroflexota bacterium]